MPSQPPLTRRTLAVRLGSTTPAVVVFTST